FQSPNRGPRFELGTWSLEPGAFLGFGAWWLVVGAWDLELSFPRRVDALVQLRLSVDEQVADRHDAFALAHAFEHFPPTVARAPQSHLALLVDEIGRASCRERV